MFALLCYHKESKRKNAESENCRFAVCKTAETLIDVKNRGSFNKKV